jgi:hypothetical protein
MISQTLQAMGDEAVAPLADRMGSDAEIGATALLLGSCSHAKMMRLAGSVPMAGFVGARSREVARVPLR